MKNSVGTNVAGTEFFDHWSKPAVFLMEFSPKGL